MPTLEEEYKQYQGSQGVNDMYDAQKEAKLAGLESAYQQSRSDAEAAKAQIPGQYQQRANDLAVQYERNRRNLNQQAAATGLNTGAGSQMQLALGGQYQRDYGNIRTAQQQALDAADKGIRDLENAYRSSVQQAVADNDYQRAQALLAEYKTRYQQQLQQAQNLAGYGDFSGYAGVPGYTDEQIARMRAAWAANDPTTAYYSGQITADQYKQIVGRYPNGYNDGSGSLYEEPYTPPPTSGGAVAGAAAGIIGTGWQPGQGGSGGTDSSAANAVNNAIAYFQSATTEADIRQHYFMIQSSAAYAGLTQAQKDQLSQAYQAAVTRVQNAGKP